MMRDFVALVVAHGSPPHKAAESVAEQGSVVKVQLFAEKSNSASGCTKLALVAASGAMLEEMKRLALDVQQLGAELIVIGDDESILCRAEVGLQLPQGIPERLSPLVTIVPGQLLSMHLAAARGIDLDRPRALRKVTETR